MGSGNSTASERVHRTTDEASTPSEEQLSRRRISRESMSSAKLSGRLLLNNTSLKDFPLQQLLDADVTGVKAAKAGDPVKHRLLTIIDLSFNQLEYFPRSPLPFPSVECLDLSGNQLGRRIPVSAIVVPETTSTTDLSEPPKFTLQRKPKRKQSEPTQPPPLEKSPSLARMVGRRESSGSGSAPTSPRASGELVQVAESSGLVEAMSGLEGLKTLVLSFNGLTAGFDLGPVAAHLVELKIQYNRLSTLEQFDLAKMVKLENLDAKGNTIQQLAATSLAGLLPSLKRLDLTTNDLESFAFEEPLPSSLVTLELGDNRLRSLPGGFFGNLPNLVTLNLENNAISSLPAFPATLSNLTTLYLADNKLTELPSSIGLLKALHKLEVSRNRLRELPAEIGALERLDTLDISSNYLKALPSTIGDLSLLRLFIAGGNNIRTIPAEFGRLNKKLCVVILRRNRLRTSVDLEPLFECVSLMELDLCANGLKEISASLNKLSMLSVLRLAGNRLTTFPELTGLTCFTTQPLERVPPALYLNDNRFTEFPKSLLACKTLKVLTLDNNPISVLPPEITNLTELSTLSISLKYNPDKPSTLPNSITVGNLKRLYLCGTLPHGPGVPVPPLPLFLTDTDITQSDRLPPLTRAANNIRDRSHGCSRPVAFAQLLGAAPHALEDALATTSVAWRDSQRLDYAAVFDGHGGSAASLFCQTNFHDVLEAQLALQAEVADEVVAITQALKAAFFEVNNKLREYLDNSRRAEAVVGCTGVVVVITQTHLFSANAGDSRAVLTRRSTYKPAANEEEEDPIARRAHLIEAVRLSVDHKPHLRTETARIVSAGGFITQDPQRGSSTRLHSPNVGNGLAVSRALGDFPLCPPLIVDPFVAVRKLDAQDLFVILACDGIWDVLTDHEAALIAAGSSVDIQEDYNDGVKPDEITGHSLTEAVHRLRGWAYALDSFDDLSVLIMDVGHFFQRK